MTVEPLLLKQLADCPEQWLRDRLLKLADLLSEDSPRDVRRAYRRFRESFYEICGMVAKGRKRSKKDAGRGWVGGSIRIEPRSRSGRSIHTYLSDIFADLRKAFF